MCHVIKYYTHCREHDKGPEDFCFVLLKLMDDQLPFNVSILGTHTGDIPGNDTYILLLYNSGFLRMFAENCTAFGFPLAPQWQPS